MTIGSTRRKWYGLALLLTVQFMVVLDIAIVNVALPSIGKDLHFPTASLQWVVSAYALFFGGFLLLFGRVADLIGRRKVFLIGLVVFASASLLSGLAWNEASLIIARATQGLGAAMVTPAALSILMTTFKEGKERNLALGGWGGVGAFGAVAGVLAGGVLTEYLNWSWIFFVNVPVAIVAFGLAPLLLDDSRDEHAKSFDLPGAVLVTGGLVTLVYGITQANHYGWTSVTTWAILASAGVILAAFLFWESRQAEPLVPFSIFRLRTLVGANVAGLILGTASFSVFLMLTLYMQNVLHYSAVQTGLAYLAIAATAILWSGLAAQLVTRIGVKPVLTTGMVFLTAGLLYFTQVSVGGNYVDDLLPGFLLMSVGLGFSFVPISIAALAGVKADDAGLASGLFNTSQQIGGALGIAILSAVVTSVTSNKVADGASVAQASVDGYQAAFIGAAALAAVGILVSLTVIRRSDLVEPAGETVEAPPLLEAA
jgi:EmrB/QacA subfamily drug resistance transporter